jgi:hypothetical protein
MDANTLLHSLRTMPCSVFHIRHAITKPEVRPVSTGSHHGDDRIDTCDDISQYQQQNDPTDGGDARVFSIEDPAAEEKEPKIKIHHRQMEPRKRKQHLRLRDKVPKDERIDDGGRNHDCTNNEKR